jgi:diguanylate cyclase (GGDEF)-like protein/PAS domain S-box-containing protein
MVFPCLCSRGRAAPLQSLPGRPKLAAVKPSDAPAGLLGLAPDDGRTRTEQLYSTLFATNEALLRAASAAEAYRRFCEAATGSGFIASAGVLLPEGEPPDRLRFAASAGLHDWSALVISVADDKPEGRGMVGTAYRSRQPCVCDDMLTDPRLAPWRAAALQHGVRSGAGIPLLREGRVVAILLFYSTLPAAFDEPTVRLLERMADSVRHAVEVLEREAERRRLEEETQRFRAAVELSGDTVVLTDVETLRFVDVNETACERLGYTRAQLLTMGPLDISERTEAQVRTVFAQAVACAPEPLLIEQVTMSRDGRRWTSEVSRRAFRAGGRWLIVTIGRDVSERLRQQRLQVLQHGVTRQLAQTGPARSVLDRVLRDICEELGAAAAACVLPAEGPGGAPQRLAYWQRPAPQSPLDAAGDGALLEAVLACGRDGTALQGADGRMAVPICAEGRAIGALQLADCAPVDGLAPLLVAIGEQVGQYIRRKQAERVVARNEARFRSLTELSSDWYWECDADHRFTSFGGSSRGHDRGDWRSAFLGRRVWELPNVVSGSADWDTHRATLARRERFTDIQFAVRRSSGAVMWTSASGEPWFDDDGSFIGYHGVSRDITKKRLAEDSIRHLATHDTLTGLPNRALFMERLGQALADGRAGGGPVGVLFVDLDHFKIINDTLGHDAGDLLLQNMAHALRDCLRAGDLLARLGGDEFVVLVRQPAQRADVAVVAKKLLAAATQPLALKGHECRVSASIGIAMFPDDADDEAALMKGADTAMYEAKREGRNGFRFFSAAAAPAHTLRRLAIGSHLRQALERDELELHYQPKVDLESGRIVGAEALLRWTHAELGAVSPAEFIPVAEETGLILPIGRWVLRRACEQHVLWRASGLPAVPLAVNLSPRQFHDDELPADITRTLRETGMQPEALELEVTEGIVVGNPERAVATLQAIKRMGVKLAVDDFGTGYSSLAQIKRFPIDTLKLDRSFVSGLPDDPHDSAITEAVIVMCRALNLAVVAEGVETLAQREFLRRHGCAQMQGYQFSRPLPAADFAALVRRNLG